jgi:ComF family protein
MLTRIKNAFLKALYPDKCLSCGLFFHVGDQFEAPSSAAKYFKNTSLKTIYQKEMAAFLCPSCIKEFSPITQPFCLQCGKEFESSVSDNHLCEDCIRKINPYQRIRSAGMLNGSLMDALHQLKYTGKIQFARPLGRLLYSAFLTYFNDIIIDLVIPVPLHVSKLRSRGFNQVILLLAEWPAIAASDDSSFPTIDFQGRIMARKKKTESQTGLGRDKRKTNVKGAFWVLQPESIKAKQVILIDDVYTTGATTGECAEVLMKHGAKSVHILTLARAN